MDRFNEKTIIFYGIEGELCQATALRAAKEGARIVLADNNNAADSDRLVDIIKEFSPRVEIVSYDLSEKENCIKIIELAKRVFGSVDILIDNTGNIFEAAELVKYVTSAIETKAGGALIAISKTASEEELIENMAKKYSSKNITVNEVVITASADEVADTVCILHQMKAETLMAKLLELMKLLERSEC